MDGMEDKQAQAAPPFVDAATEPIDLAQAFKMLNQAERAASEEPVAEAEAGRGDEPGDEPGEDAGAGSQGESADGGVQAPAEPGGGAALGGSATGINAVDFNARKQSILQDIQRRSASDVRDEFKQQGIDYYSINELTVRDERSGQIRFRNPDVAKDDERNPDYYFKSRAEAMAFIDAWNKGVDNEFRKAVNQKQKQLVEEQSPAIRLIDFAPTYFSMSEVERNVFEQLVAPFSVKDGKGDEIGYSCDLYQMGEQAKAIAKQFAPQAPAAGQVPAAGKQESSGPAMDMKTGTGKASDDEEPKTLGEALKMFDKKNRSK